jgi:hypothetical protein
MIILYCKNDNCNDQLMKIVKKFPDHQISFPELGYSIIPAIYKCNICGLEAFVEIGIHWVKKGESILNDKIF